MADLIGRTLGQYHILREIGRGGMAIVYEAQQPALGRTVAIKVLPPHYTFDRTFVQRFLHEGRAAARLNHPHIVSIYDVGEEDGVYYIVMQKVEGESLQALIHRTGRLALPRAAHILTQVASALDHAHAHGLVHRDIKPANIIVGPDDYATLTDFGIVKAAEGTALTQTGTLMGTPEYMSPEQARGESAGAPSDLYALGVTVYEMLTGKAPFRADSPVVVLYKQAFEAPTPVRAGAPELPPAAEAVIMKALAKEPVQRFQSAGEMARALAKASPAGPELSPSRPMVTTPSSPKRAIPSVGTLSAQQGRRVSLTLAVGVLVLGVVVFGALGLNRLFSQPEAAFIASADETPLPASSSQKVLGEVPACLSFGDMVPFTSDRDGTPEIYCLARTGVVQMTHTPGDGASWQPAPVPNGDILFTSDRSGKREIWSLTHNGVGQWTHTPEGGESWGPALAPNGDILFSSDRSGKREIWGLTQAGAERWTNTPGNGESWGPASTQGGEIFFTSDRSGKREIWGLTPQGVVQWTHTPGEAESWAPAPAANGDILFTSDRNGKPEVYRLTHEGVTRVIHTAGDGWSSIDREE